MAWASGGNEGATRADRPLNFPSLRSSRKTVDFKRFYVTLLTFDILVWFVAVPAIVNLHLTGDLLRPPSVGEYVMWQLIGFAVTWLAMHVTYRTTSKK